MTLFTCRPGSFVISAKHSDGVLELWDHELG